MSDDLFSRIVHYDPEKEVQLRLTVNEFRNVQYLHIRKYFLDFEGNWVPTKEGISMPLMIQNSLALFLALSELVSAAEKELVDEALADILEIYTSNTKNEPDSILG